MLSGLFGNEVTRVISSKSSLRKTPIPLATRWFIRKRETARSKLKRGPTSEELILEYKGLLNSKTKYKENALKSFRKAYGKLEKK
jgi:hypothetical protein